MSEPVVPIRPLPGDTVLWLRKNLLGAVVEMWPLPRAWLHYQLAEPCHPFGYWRVTPPPGSGMPTAFNLDVRDTIGGQKSSPWVLEVVKGAPTQGGWDEPPKPPDEPDAPAIVTVP